MTTFAVITPTIGSDHLVQCVASLKDQECIHHIFVDGMQYADRVMGLINDNNVGHKNLRVSFLHENVGKAGGDWYGHRIYAAASFLVNEEYICYLDEDNWVNSYYIKAFEHSLSGQDWGFTLRSIYSKDGEYLFEDNCESLGKWPIYGDEKNGFHIDTSCYAVSRKVAVQIGHAWYGQYAADRQFFANLSTHFPKFACTKKHTVCYRLDGNPKSVKKEFFEKGNEHTVTRYGDQFPWHDPIPTIR